MTAEKTAQLTSIEVNPPSTIKHSVIWLHGLGADGNDFVPIVKELHLPDALGVRFVFPHAPIIPITINNGYEMRAWYNISQPDLHDRIDKAGIQQSVSAVHQLIQHEMERGLSATNIILAGFSQGAAIALSTGLCYPQKLGGLIALSGYLPLMEDVLQNATAVNRQTPIFIAHGMEDFLVPEVLSKKVVAALEQAGYPVSSHSYAMQHTVCLEEVNDISAWMRGVCV